MCIHEVPSRVCIGKHLCDAFLFNSGLKDSDALSPLLISFAQESLKRIRRGWN